MSDKKNENKGGGLLRKLLLLILVAVLGGAGYLSYDYNKKHAAWPWSSKEDWKRFSGEAAETTTHVAQKAAEQAQKAAEQAKTHGGAAWAYTTAKTHELYDRSKGLLARMGQDDEDHPPAAGTAAPTPPADPLEAKSQNYRYGKEALANGVQAWRQSLNQPGAAERAKKQFELAIRNFEAAQVELGGDKHVEEYLDEARAYLADTEERLRMIKAAEAKGSS